MKMLLKLLFYGAIVTGGGALAVAKVPSLRANIIEVINPRVKETRLLGELQQHLDQLAGVPASASDSAPAGGIRTVTAREEIVKKAKDLVAEISAINTSNSGLVQNGVTTLVNTLTSTLSGSGTHSGSSTSPQASTVTTSPVVPSVSASATAPPCVVP